MVTGGWLVSGLVSCHVTEQLLGCLPSESSPSAHYLPCFIRWCVPICHLPTPSTRCTRSIHTSTIYMYAGWACCGRRQAHSPPCGHVCRPHTHTHTNTLHSYTIYILYTYVMVSMHFQAVHVADAGKRTALHEAAAAGHRRGVRVLLLAGGVGQARVRNSLHAPCVHAACRMRERYCRPAAPKR